MLNQLEIILKRNHVYLEPMIQIMVQSQATMYSLLTQVYPTVYNVYYFGTDIANLKTE
jgi:hypothetical protein